MNKKSRTQNAMINIVTGFSSQLLLTIMQFVCRTVFIKTLGTEYLGINGLFSNILSLLSLTELGLDTAINFKLYKPLKDNDEHRVQILMKFYKLAYLVVGLVILVIGVILIPFLPMLVKDYGTFAELGINPVLVFSLFLLNSVTSYLFFASRSAILKADQKSYITTAVSSLCIIVQDVVQIIVLVVLKSFILYVALAIVFGILTNLINALIAKKQYRFAFQKTKDSLSIAEIKDIFKDLGALFIFKVNGVVLKATDNLVLSSFIGLAIVGLYSNYLILYTTIKSFLSKIYNSIKATMGNLYAGDDLEKQYKFFEIFNFATFLLYGTCAVGVAVCADELINCWLGADYLIAQPFSILVGCEIIMLGIKQNLNQVRNVTGAFRQMWYRPLMGIVINLTISIVGVNICGIYGVLIGTVTADVLTNFLIDPKIIHEYSLKNIKPVSVYYARNMMYFLLLFLTGAMDMYICSVFFTGCGWLSLIVHILICGLSVPVLFILVFYRRHESRYFISLFKKIVLKKIKK